MDAIQGAGTVGFEVGQYPAWIGIFENLDDDVKVVDHDGDGSQGPGDGGPPSPGTEREA